VSSKFRVRFAALGHVLQAVAAEAPCITVGEAVRPMASAASSRVARATCKQDRVWGVAVMQPWATSYWLDVYSNTSIADE
jgi:hypothetical protein